MFIYDYDPTTGALVGEREARRSPLYDPEKHEPEEEFLVPANATVIAPPACGENEVPCFADGAWVVKADHRGKTCYDKNTKAEVTISEIGEMPQHLTELVPGEFDVWEDGSSSWIADLPGAKSKGIFDAKTEAQRRIILIVPEWKQRNLLARSSELLERKLDNLITSEEEAELLDIKAIWGQITAIRSASDNIEAEINTKTSVDAVQNYDVQNSSAWPV